ncbi:hypothetical protein D9M68_697380 [compost metagenome]
MQPVRRPRPQVGAGLRTQPPQLGRGDLADPVDAIDRQRGDEGIDRRRADHEQAVGLVPVAGDLGDELARPHAGRNGHADLVAHALADFFGNAGGAAGMARAEADVEVGLVQRQRFDQPGVFAVDRKDLARHLAILVHGRAQDQQIRAVLERLRRRHGRAHAERTRFVVAGGDHPAPVGRAAHGHRPAAQRRVVAHLDRGVETVAVAMDDLALDRGRGIRRRGHGRAPILST